MSSNKTPASLMVQSDKVSKGISLNPEDFGLPLIDAGNNDLPSATQEALDALCASNLPERIFCRGNSFVRVEIDELGRPRITTLDVDRLRGELARAANYYKKQRNGTSKPEYPPLAVVRDILAQPSPPFPILYRITQIPVFAPDGTLQLWPGYNETGRIYYVPKAGFAIPTVPKNPTKEDVAKACNLILDELFVDFPFAVDADKANAASLMIQPAVRELIQGPTPIYGIDKPTPGTGASLLCEMIAFIVSGEKPSILSAPPDEAEMRRTLFAALLGGPEILLIDNIRGKLDSPALSAITTSEYYTDRRVGSSEALRVPNRCACIVTGNNLQLSQELARRTILIHMDAKMERPWERQEQGFRHSDLRGWVSKNRANLVWAVLTLVQNWIAQGRPKHSGCRIGSFESWSDTLGGILDCAGIKGFLGNRENLYQQSDSETACWIAFVNRWWEKYQDKEVAASELVDLGEGLKLGNTPHSAATSLGRQIREKRGCIFDGLKITEATTRKGYPQWKLVKA